MCKNEALDEIQGSNFVEWGSFKNKKGPADYSRGLFELIFFLYRKLTFMENLNFHKNARLDLFHSPHKSSQLGTNGLDVGIANGFIDIDQIKVVNGTVLKIESATDHIGIN